VSTTTTCLGETTFKTGTIQPPAYVYEPYEP
jgi:hypothetical protein